MSVVVHKINEYEDHTIIIEYPGPTNIDKKLIKHASIGRIEHYVREIFSSIGRALKNLKDLKLVFLPRIEKLIIKEERINKKLQKIMELSSKKNELETELDQTNKSLKSQQTYRTTATGQFSWVIEHPHDRKYQIENQLRYIESKLEKDNSLQVELASIKKEISIFDDNDRNFDSKITKLKCRIQTILRQRTYKKNEIEDILKSIKKREIELNNPGKFISDRENKFLQLKLVKGYLKNAQQTLFEIILRKLSSNLNSIESLVEDPAQKLKIIRQARRELEEIASDPYYSELISKNLEFKERSDKVHANLSALEAEYGLVRG